jgi:hypothetical protein
MGDDLRMSLPTFTMRSESRPSTAGTNTGWTTRDRAAADSSRAENYQSTLNTEAVSSAGAEAPPTSIRQSLAVWARAMAKSGRSGMARTWSRCECAVSRRLGGDRRASRPIRGRCTARVRTTASISRSASPRHATRPMASSHALSVPVQVALSSYIYQYHRNDAHLLGLAVCGMQPSPTIRSHRRLLHLGPGTLGLQHLQIHVGISIWSLVRQRSFLDCVMRCER